MCYRIGLRLFSLLALIVMFSLGLVITGCNNPFTTWPQAVISITGNGTPYGTAPFTITFDISGSYDPDGEIVAFTLDFGDGSQQINGTDITQTIRHTYEEPGSYFPKLTVLDNDGAKRSVILAIQVSAPDG
jgi:PKD repeat protein